MATSVFKPTLVHSNPGKREAAPADAYNSVIDTPVDAAYAPAVRAFLADRQDGMSRHQMALARAVMLARRVC